jgi:APA family basic amino acid/polyamine antiporter
MLPNILSKLSKTHVPTYATLTLGALATITVLSGTFEILSDTAVFMALLINGFAVSSIFILRKKAPNVKRPYRVWGYPYIPALFLLATLCLLINTLIATPLRALSGLGLLGAGLLVYLYYAKKLPPDKKENWFVP